MLKFNSVNKVILIAFILIVTITVGGWLINYSIKESQYTVDNRLNHQQLIDKHFNNALVFMQNRQYQQAFHQWHQLLILDPEMPEAHVNLGFTLYELEKYEAASEYFKRAMDISPYQVNAYYGLAICYEKLGDIQAATGAMKSYIHLANKDDPFVRKARSALWEWEGKLDNPEETMDKP